MSWKHISGWVQVTEPEGPSGPVDPGYGRPGWAGRPDNSLPWAPVRPDNGLPWGPARPDNSLPWAPVHPGNKPPGRPILPPHIDNGLPPGAPLHPWAPGHWEPVDPGFGKPPLWAFIPTDPGFGLPETPPPTTGGGPVLPGDGSGQWVPLDPDYGIPDRCPGGKPHPPIWGWVPAPPVLPDHTLPPTPEPK